MVVFRLSRVKYADSLNGIGAARMGQRWNSKGIEVVYVASNRSLAVTEILVNLNAEIFPIDYQMISILIPDDIPIYKPEIYPKGWNDIPKSQISQLVGDAFVREQKFLVMKVPSVVVKGEFNYLINPAHPDFDKVSIVEKDPFMLDERLFRV